MNVNYISENTYFLLSLRRTIMETEHRSDVYTWLVLHTPLYHLLKRKKYIKMRFLIGQPCHVMTVSSGLHSTVISIWLPSICYKKRACLNTTNTTKLRKNTRHCILKLFILKTKWHHPLYPPTITTTPSCLFIEYL